MSPTTTAPATDQAALDTAIGSAWVRGDDDALAQAFQRWSPLVHGLARRAVGPDEAEDVTQQVFLSAWRGRTTYDPGHGPLGAWLVGITRRRVADALRARHVTTEVPTPADQLPDDGVGLARHDVDDLITVYEELERIGDPARQVLLLAYVHGRTQREIAALLNLPLGTVKTHANRTLARLRSTLGGGR